jgi:hypothetical protein
VAYQFFETSIVNRVLAAEARMLFVPRDVVDSLEPGAIGDTGVLGVRLGVPIPDADGLVDVFYASLQGRVYTFDPDSFGRWRPRWQGEDSEASRFARGEAWVANGVDWAAAHPMHALGVVIIAEGAILVADLRRAFHDTIVVAAKYHLRRALGVPPDWMPPEDK